MERVQSAFGLIVLIALAWAFSENRKRIQWRTVYMGIALQIIFGLLILKTPLARGFFDGATVAFNGLLAFTAKGSEFLFGTLANPQNVGFVFATMVLPTIIFVSALMSVLYHIGIMQKVVNVFAIIMMKTMRTSGAESVASAANIFLGQTEAPLVIKPYLRGMTRSEIMCLMTGGMANVAGGVLAAYVGFGIDAGHLLAASVMSAPATMVVAKLLVPETEESETAGHVKIEVEKTTVNAIDAAAVGTTEGLALALNVGAMLLAFIALVAMLNAILGSVGGVFGFPQLSFELVSGYAFAPVAWLMGCPWADSLTVGALLGKKIIINEFVAYLDLKAAKDVISERSFVISTYALCGFANLSSIGIQIGGIGVLVPEKRQLISRYGMKALFAGTLCTLMTACIAGMFL